MGLRLYILLSLLVSYNVSGQTIYKADNGKVKFFSDALFEDIEAVTKKATAALNASTGDVAVLIPIKSFVFKKSLMQEHFNENYLESDKYPEATFKGKIADINVPKPGEKKQVIIPGMLTIHGVPQSREITVTLETKTDGSVWVTGNFEVKVADHKVKIPSIVFQNIAELVEVTFEILLK